MRARGAGGRFMAGVIDELLEVSPATNGYCKTVRSRHSDGRPAVRVRVRRAGSRGTPLTSQYCAEHFPRTWRPLFEALAALALALLGRHG